MWNSQPAFGPEQQASPQEIPLCGSRISNVDVGM